MALMQVAPSDFGRRLKQEFQSEPRMGIRELAALVEETYTIVEKEIAEMDVARLRRIFRYWRQTWDEAPNN